MPSQSLLDFINFFPLQAIQIPRTSITDKEAKTLMQIWNGNKDDYNNLIVPDDADPLVLASLISKGLVVSKYARPTSRAVEMSKKGKEVVRNIILQTEQSSFERISSRTTRVKTASCRASPRNWLERAILWI